MIFAIIWLLYCINKLNLHVFHPLQTTASTCVSLTTDPYDKQGVKHTCIRQTALLSSSQSSPSVSFTCVIWLVEIYTWQPHPSLLLLHEAHGDGCCKELPALSIRMSSQLHPLRDLKGNFLRLIAERWMPGWRPRGCNPSSSTIT